jgi:hypothetical protein
MTKSPKATCANCRHMLPGRREVGMPINQPVPLLCRRYPPQVNLVVSPQGMVTTISSWPAVTPDDACGEFLFPFRLVDDGRVVFEDPTPGAA